MDNPWATEVGGVHDDFCDWEQTHQPRSQLDSLPSLADLVWKTRTDTEELGCSDCWLTFDIPPLCGG